MATDMYYGHKIADDPEIRDKIKKLLQQLHESGIQEEKETTVSDVSDGPKMIEQAPVPRVTELL